MKSFKEFLKESMTTSDISGIDHRLYTIDDNPETYDLDDYESDDNPETYDLDDYESDDNPETYDLDDYCDELPVLLSFYHDLSDEKITEFVNLLATEFFEYENTGETYTYEDLVDISIELLKNGVSSLEVVDFLGLAYDEDSVIESIEGMFTARSFNRSKRKFFTKSAAQLRKDAAKRHLDNLKSRSTRKSYYRQNRAKLARYAKMYKRAIKRHIHNKKLRRRS